MEKIVAENHPNDTKKGILNKRNYSKMIGRAEMTIDEIKSYIKSPDQFIWLFSVELGYLLPPRSYITWPFMLRVLTGDKILLKSKAVKITAKIPKIKELKLRVLWDMFKDDKTLHKYMPMINSNRLPPRNYFFSILSTIYTNKFEEIMNKANQSRRRQLKSENKIFSVKQDLLNEIKHSQVWNELPNQRTSKRIAVNPRSRKRIK
jgi:hypothetical protein